MHADTQTGKGVTSKMAVGSRSAPAAYVSMGARAENGRESTAADACTRSARVAGRPACALELLFVGHHVDEPTKELLAERREDKHGNKEHLKQLGGRWEHPDEGCGNQGHLRA